MKTLIILVICLSSLAVYQAETVGDVFDELKPMYESDAWKRSVAFDAPVIQPEETLKLLNQLKEIAPKNKNQYKEKTPEAGSYYYYLEEAENQTEKDDGPVDRAEAKEWRKNEVFGTINRYIDNLIEYSKNSQYLRTNLHNCANDDFKFMYYITDGENSLSSVERNKPFGPNIMAYINYHRHNLLKSCAQNLIERSKLNNDERNSLEQMANTVFPNGYNGNPSQFNNLDDNSDIIVNGIAKYLVDSISNKKDKKKFQAKFKNMSELCKKHFASGYVFGFLEYGLKQDDLAPFILSDPLMKMQSFEFKICQNLQNRQNDNLLKKVEKEAGVHGKLRNLF